MVLDPIKVINPIRDYHDPRRRSQSQRHENSCSAQASAAANSGCRCVSILRTWALFSRARWAFTGDIWLTVAPPGGQGHQAGHAERQI